MKFCFRLCVSEILVFGVWTMTLPHSVITEYRRFGKTKFLHVQWPSCLNVSALQY
jgi:hypothetical protein